VLTAIASGMRGEALMALGAFGDAERDFLRAAKVGHAPAGAWMRVGRARAEAGHGDPSSPSLGYAVEALDEAIKLHPSYEDARVLRGEILGLQGRDAEAEKELQHMRRLRPDSVRALDALARLYHRQGKREEAHRLASIGLGYEPEDKRLTWIYKETRPR
jgi:predicted Zn-dependent protease